MHAQLHIGNYCNMDGEHTTHTYTCGVLHVDRLRQTVGSVLEKPLRGQQRSAPSTKAVTKTTRKTLAKSCQRRLRLLLPFVSAGAIKYSRSRRRTYVTSPEMWHRYIGAVCHRRCTCVRAARVATRFARLLYYLCAPNGERSARTKRNKNENHYNRTGGDFT